MKLPKTIYFKESTGTHLYLRQRACSRYRDIQYELKDVKTTRKQYNPDFPKTLQGAIRLIEDFEKEYAKETTQFCKGVRYGASYLLTILRQLKHNLKK